MRALPINRAVSAVAGLLLLAAPSFGQDEGPPQMQCLRYLDSYERSLRIPQGLTTAISLVETGRPLGPNKQLLPWPWTINVNGQGRFFDSKEEAVAETRKMIDEGQRSIDIGCMQVNLRYHPNAFRSLEDAFDPATNTAYGAQFLVSLHQAQGSWEKAVERYHSSDDGKRGEYRDKVLGLWNGDVRNLVMDAVLAENTNTPYHHAMQDFAQGHYEEALAKYQAILKDSPKDRLGLLGVAMTSEQLNRVDEADEAYASYLVVAPEDGAVLTRLIKKARSMPAATARQRLEGLVKAGVVNAELFSALADLTAKEGNNEAAFKYAAQAVENAPSVTAYHLNAGILADRLKRTAVAVKYYEDFLAMIASDPRVVDTSIESIRTRVSFLQTRP